MCLCNRCFPTIFAIYGSFSSLIGGGAPKSRVVLGAGAPRSRIYKYIIYIYIFLSLSRSLSLYIYIDSYAKCLAN